MLKVLILGSGSFIGSHLVRLLSKDDISISVFGRNEYLLPDVKVNFFQGDFDNGDCLKKALQDQDVVYHFISTTIPSNSWDKPIIEIEKNLIPTLKLIELASECGVKKICFASSGGTVYGLREKVLTEDDLTEPFSPYGIIKRTIESFLQYARAKSGLNYDIYRISNVYGEGQQIHKGLGFINTALENIVLKQPITIYGNGEIVRDFIYVEDVAKLLTLSLNKGFSDSDIYNISSNNPVSLNDLIGIMKNALGLDFEVVYLPARVSDNKKVVLDNSKIMRNFIDLNLTSLERGIEKTFRYLEKRINYVKKSV
jgi:UDP-glucose 4-epimerase